MKTRAVAQSLFPDIQPDKPIGYILPSVFTGTNAELMRAVAPYYLTGSVMDCTYGEGNWWTLCQPPTFFAHDLYKLDGVDFRHLPEPDRSINTVCYDPPYVISGGTESSTAGEFLDRFGIGDLGAAELYRLILDGLDEVCRVASHYVLVKCMEFAQGGRFHDIPNVVTNAARGCGWQLHDRIVHHTGAGPGGHNIFTPLRARRHHSYLLVFTKGAA